jgi:VWFA-related protein
MPTPKRRLVKTLLTAALFSIANFAPAIYSQQTDRSQTQDGPTEVIRTNTELVQTEVMVFDAKGRFVDGLRPEQFELVLAGTKQPVSFFERITAGSQAEAAQLAAARRNPANPVISANKTGPSNTAAVGGTDVGRVLFFFLDDLHTSPASLARARKALLRFVDEQMNPNDQVAIVSSSGQVGFLQQLTDNPAMLHAAINRLNDKFVKEGYPGKTQISEYMASQIEDYKNKQLLAYLMEATKLEQQMGPGTRHGDHRPAASYSSLPFIENRVNQINTQSRLATMGTLDALKGLMLSSATLPGRKVVVFLSDGFLVSERKSGVLDALEGVTEAAKRSGVIVYTMDLRGTSFGMGSTVDVSSSNVAEFSARKIGMAGEVAATQEPLKRIAEETGGRAILNSNAISAGISQAISETSDYYLLAWRPDSDDQRQGKLRLRVIVKDRPELRVRLRNNVYQPPVQSVAKANKNDDAKAVTAVPSASSVLPATASPTSPGSSSFSFSSPLPAEAQLLQTLGSLYPKKQLPVSLAVGYLNASDGGLTLKLSMQIDREALDLAPESKPQQEIDVLGVAVDDRGLVASFKHVLTVPREAAGQDRKVIWHQQLRVKPGLYQVRVALRERSTGRTGSAMQWIELPEDAAVQFGLSSLFLGERRADDTVAASGSASPAPISAGPQAISAGQPVSAGPQPISVDVDHKFARGSALRFQTYVYNAARGEKGPEVSIEAQVLRNRQPVMRIAPAKVPLTNDAARLPYWSEIALKDLPPGYYVLLLTATDHLANRTASQRVNFIVE